MVTSISATALTRQAQEAKSAAVDEVERLLQHSEDLKRLHTLCQDHGHKQQVTKSQLGTTISSQLDTVNAGIEMIGSSMRALGGVQVAFQTIDELCLECSALIEHHEKIQLLSMVQGNLRKTLCDVENIAELPQEAAAAEELLHDNSQLLEAYQCLAALEGTATLAQQTLDGIEALDQQELCKLNLYFERVKATMQRFEERIFSLLRDFISIGQQDPALLVVVLRIVEMQEHVDRQIQASSQGLETKRYLQQCDHQMSQCISDTFAALLQQSAALASAGAGTDHETRDILTQAQQLVVQLTDIYDRVLPCFPPNHQAFGKIFQSFHEHLSSVLDCIGAASAAISNDYILQVVSWAADFQQTCRDLGLRDEQSAFRTGSGSGTQLLVAQYASRTYEMLHKWSVNILQADMKSEPRMAEDGRLWTPGSVDFFRTINEQVNVVEKYSTGELLLQTAQAALTVVDEYQVAQETYLRQGLQVGLLCALVNNNSRCYDDAVEFAEHMNTSLFDELKGQLAAEKQTAAFLVLAKLATWRIARSIFEDAALRELFLKIGSSAEWLQGPVTDTILATLEDYLAEFLTYLQPAFASRLSAAVVSDMAVHYLAALLSGTESFSDASSQAVESDVAAISGFFENYMPPSKVAKMVQPLIDAKGLAASDSADGFVLSYTALLDIYPGLASDMVEPLLLARADISAAEAKDVGAECRDVYQQKLRQLGCQPAPAIRFLNFDAVLAALGNAHAW